MTSEPERKKAKTDHIDSSTVIQDRVKELQEKILVLKEEYPELACIDQSRLHGCLDEAFVKYKSEQSKIENERHCPLYKLPNEILQKCFEYVGDDSYLFTATVSKKFHDEFTSKFVSNQKINNGKLTSYRYGASSTSLTKYCVENLCKTQDEKDKIFIAGAVNGNIEILEYASEERYDLLPIIAHSSLDWDDVYERSGIARIASKGHLHVLKYLYENVNFRMCMQFASNEAIGCGRLDIIEWLNIIGCLKEKYDGDFCCEASRYEKVDTLKWLIEKGYSTELIGEDLLNIGDSELVEYCLSKGVEFEEEAINTIAYSDNIYFAENCQDIGLKMTSDAYFNAIESGSLEMVKFLHRSGIPWYSEYTVDATRMGDFDMLKFARENGCPWHPKTSACAAKYSDLEFLQYLHTNGCPWHPETFKEFLLKEKYTTDEVIPTVDVFRFLHENGCPWDKRFSRSVIEMKNISFLKYLNENGLPYVNDLLALALNLRWFDGVKYIIESERKCENPADLRSVVNTVKFKCHDFEILKYLKSTGMEWSVDKILDDISALSAIAHSDKFDDNFEVFRLDVMKYLLGKKCPGEEYCYEYALKNQQVEVVKLLYKGYNFKQKDLFDIAFKKWLTDPTNQQKRDILAYLQRHGCPQNNTFDYEDK
ncbi:hypothetical protein CTEN210_11496 [Chaetoceros tenuissimus]|uniref:F-box domain-containing protein n=1 Tax=Chaetoceros tenuissimus TaxID=426638 RepID=A0AAD3D1M5_9STRA|nr:hypothetical protein CTEN210_11496 [Chaetoceros tenuissimus]